MDKKLANNLIVGLFVLISFGGFLFVLFNISGGKGVFSQDYKLYGRFKHVKGLFYGSEVSLSGFRIGTVTRISVDDKGTKELIVEFTVSKDVWDKLRADSTATIKTSGVLGDKYIEVGIGSIDQPQLTPGQFITTEEPEDIFSKTGDAVGDISQHFTKNGDFARLLANLNKLSANLAQITSEIKPNVGKASQHLEQILNKVNKGDGTLASLINDPTVYEDLKAVMGGAKRSAILKYFMRQFIEDGSSNSTPVPVKKKGE